VGNGQDEIANWYFSDEDLAEAICNIVDVPTYPRRERKPVARNSQAITNIKEDINGKK
jgi:hypothetical protein